MSHRPFTFILASSLTLAMFGLGQPATPQHDRPTDKRPQNSQHGTTSEQDRPNARPQKSIEIRINADALRARLKRSILRAEQILERNTAALEKLDAGASPAEVLAEMRTASYARTQAGEPHRPTRTPQAKGSARPPVNAPRPVMTPEERRKLLVFLGNNFPKLSKDFRQVVKLDQRNGDRLLARMAPQIREIMYLEQTQPELSKIKVQEMRIGLNFVEASRLYRATMKNPKASDPEIAEASARLQRLAAERFDIKAKAQQFEINRLEARLDELKASVEHIQQQRASEIEHMLDAARRIPQPMARSRHQNMQPKPSGND